MEYLKIWVSFREVIEPLGDDEKGRLFDAMLRYAENGKEPELSGNERFVWPAARQSIDRAAQKAEIYRNNRSKAKQNDMKGDKTDQIVTNKNKDEQNETKSNNLFDNTNNNDNDKENDKEILKKEGGRRAAHRFSPPTPEEVEAYCRERGNGISGEAFCDVYTSKGWMIGKTPMKDWKAAVRTWEQRDGTGPKGTAKAPKAVSAQQYEQRHYTEAELGSLADDPIIRALEAAGA